MNHTKLPKKALLLLATPVMISLTVPTVKLLAQSQTETKIRLMAEGLRARDSGDLNTAKSHFEQLLVLAPNDVTVQRLLADVNARKESAKKVSSSSEEFNTNVATSSESATTTSASTDEPVSISMEALAAAEEARVKRLIADAKAANREAVRLGRAGDFVAANSKIEAAISSLPANTLTESTLAELRSTKNDLLLRRSQQLLAKGDIEGAQEALDAYIAATSPDNKKAARVAAQIDRVELSPPIRPVEDINPNFIRDQKEIAAVLARARSLYKAGDLDGAQEAYRTAEVYSPDNAEAKSMLKRIADERARLGILNREKTRATMLQEVSNAWQRPGVFQERQQTEGRAGPREASVLTQKLQNIIIPTVRFDGLALDQVINTLGALSEEFDTSTGHKGVNLVLAGQLPNTPMPTVSIRLSNMPLKRILDIITESVNHEYVVETDIVQIRPTGSIGVLESAELTIPQNAIRSMTGSSLAVRSAPSVNDPFAEPSPAVATSGVNANDQSTAIRNFLQNAGVNFSGVPGSSVLYDGSGKLLVNQTSRNIERIRQIIARYAEVKQVEIEARFMDVADANLSELGIQWGSVRTNTGTWQFSTTGNIPGGVGPNIRPLNIAAGGVNSVLPGSLNLGGASSNIGVLTGGAIGEFNIDAQLRALAQKTGSDLLSAPRATVLSGAQAELKVVQELRYPISYTDAEVQPASISTGGVVVPGTFTPSLPEEFESRDVGVTLRVKPEVEDDFYTINLTLDPEVVEFEGFVDYGSTGSAGGASFVFPSLQPIFSVRQVKTEVTIWDGATVVMGGLTREEVRRVDDKVPFLGDIPLIGRAFRSKGESSQKRNLMIFVTANLVSPGGSLRNQATRGVDRGAVFQNPTVTTPGGPEARLRSNQ